MTAKANPTKAQIADLLIEAGAAKGDKKAMMRETKDQLLIWLEEVVVAGNAPAEESEVPADARKALAKAERIAQKIRDLGGSAMARYACNDTSRIIITGTASSGVDGYELYFDGLAFSYGPSKFKPIDGTPRKVRNVSELLRLVSAS